MQGRKVREKKLFYDISLDRVVGPEHFLRKLDGAVSLEWIRGKTKQYYSHTGKPSIAPDVLVKMLLIGYLYDIRSERRLVEELSLNMAYRWYTRYDFDGVVPNHSIFSKARKKFGRELFLRIFEQIVGSCVEAGIVKAEGVFIDSTLVRVNASLDSVVEVRLPPEQYWRELEEQGRPKDPRGRKPVSAEASQVSAHANGEISAEKIGRRQSDRNPSYLRKRSATDPDATMHFRPVTGSLLSYKVHLSVTTSEIITAAAVSASAEHDTTKVPELIERHKKILGQPVSVTADRAYGTEEALGYCNLKGSERLSLLWGPGTTMGTSRKRCSHTIGRKIATYVLNNRFCGEKQRTIIPIKSSIELPRESAANAY